MAPGALKDVDLAVTMGHPTSMGKVSSATSSPGSILGKSVQAPTTKHSQLLESAEHKMAARMLFGVFITILVNYM